MYNLNIKQKFKFKSSTQFMLALLLGLTFTACKDEDDPAPVLPAPTIEDVEIGLSNNEIGVIDRDFHLNAKILAGDKIETVKIKIQQRSGETYAKEWQHEITWDQYKGAKNATVHKHFNIPSDAAEGKYDFLIIVNDQNGTKLEEKRSLTIYAAENLPVDPKLSLLGADLIIGDEPKWYYSYNHNEFNPEVDKLRSGYMLSSQATISNVKGDGKMYILLIHKKHNHRPESINDIDFSKAIVYDVYEHKDEATVFDFSNFLIVPKDDWFEWVRVPNDFTIGAAQDNNEPSAPITGAKAWESGTYYFGVIYHNSTYNTSLFHYTEFPIEIN